MARQTSDRRKRVFRCYRFLSVSLLGFLVMMQAMIPAVMAVSSWSGWAAVGPVVWFLGGVAGMCKGLGMCDGWSDSRQRDLATGWLAMYMPAVLILSGWSLGGVVFSAWFAVGLGLVRFGYRAQVQIIGDALIVQNAFRSHRFELEDDSVWIELPSADRSMGRRPAFARVGSASSEPVVARALSYSVRHSWVSYLGRLEEFKEFVGENAPRVAFRLASG